MSDCKPILKNATVTRASCIKIIHMNTIVLKLDWNIPQKSMNVNFIEVSENYVICDELLSCMSDF